MNNTRSTKPQPNVSGRFYVDEQCLACEVCIELAPTVFGLSSSLLSYVKEQPETPEELAAARTAISQCCVDAIHEMQGSGVFPPEALPEANPWWKFWK